VMKWWRETRESRMGGGGIIDKNMKKYPNRSSDGFVSFAGDAGRELPRCRLYPIGWRKGYSELGV
jgi:hypothetical protein